MIPVTGVSAGIEAKTPAERRQWMLRTMRAGLDCVDGVPETARAEIYFRLTKLDDEALARVFAGHRPIFDFARQLHALQLEGAA